MVRLFCAIPTLEAQMKDGLIKPQIPSTPCTETMRTHNSAITALWLNNALGSSSRNRLDMFSWASLSSETGLPWVGLSYRPSPHCGPLSSLSLMMGSLENHSVATAAFKRGADSPYVLILDIWCSTIERLRYWAKKVLPHHTPTLTVQNKQTKN